MPKLTRRLMLGIVAALALPAPAARAAEPMPCTGLAFVDANEASVAENRDILAGWFTHGPGGTTADLRVAALDRDLETNVGSAAFVVFYTLGAVQRYVKAETTGPAAAWTFESGSVSGGIRAADAAGPAGSVDEAAGTIEITLPDVDGVTLTQVFARSETVSTTLLDPPPQEVDRAPDDAFGEDFTPAECPPPPPPPAPSAPSAPSAAPPPASAPPPAPPVNVAPAPPTITSATPAPPFTVTVPRLSARKLRSRGRAFAVEVDPLNPVTRLTVRLSKGKRVLAKGSLASLTGAARVKVRATRRIARGTYRLTFAGIAAGGERVAGAVAVVVGR